jgi:hypothetical protein
MVSIKGHYFFLVVNKTRQRDAQNAIHTSNPLAAPDTVPSMWPQGQDQVTNLLERLRQQVFVCLPRSWFLYHSRIVLYRHLVLVVWLWFGCSMVVVIGGCWRLLLLAFVVFCEGVSFKNQTIE